MLAGLTLEPGGHYPTRLRSLLREYYPAALAAFEPWRNGLCRSESPRASEGGPDSDPGRAADPPTVGGRAQAGRHSGITANQQARLRDDYAHQPLLIEDALGKQMLALLVQLEAACTAADDLTQAVEEAFPQHPDAEIILSFPSLGVQLDARVLAEVGDDRPASADALGLKGIHRRLAYHPGLRPEVEHHPAWVKNDRLDHAGYLRAFASITASPGAKAHYRRRRDDHGDWHAAAQRNLFNRMLGQLYYCLQHHTLFEEHTALSNRSRRSCLTR